MSLPDAIIGYSGFVGSTLLKQKDFEGQFRSTNISEVGEKAYHTLVCAGAPAQKWIANKDPEADREKIDGLIEHLKQVKCETFVLISTVDVFGSPVGVNEETPVVEEGLHAYGLNRRRLEKFVESHFPNYLIVRLPGLVGPGLRKNVIFDFLNDNNLSVIDSRGVFQFYPMVNLWYDIQTALKANLKLVHFTSEPVSVADIARYGFGFEFTNELSNTPASYDFQSLHAEEFGGGAGYQYSKRETLQAVRAYAQSEPLKAKTASEAH